MIKYWGIVVSILALFALIGVISGLITKNNSTDTTTTMDVKTVKNDTAIPSAETLRKLEVLRKKTTGPFNERVAMEKICIDTYTQRQGGSPIILWTDNQRTVLEFDANVPTVMDGPDTYFNGQGEEVLTIPNRPIKINDPEADTWNLERKYLLKDLKRTETLFCPEA